MEWKNLDISNIPSDFFVNERYEVQLLLDNKDGITAEWHTIHKDPSNRYDVIKDITMDVDYRYRLKPLEPIRITRAINDKIIKYCPTADVYAFKNDDGTMFVQIDGRKVEIID